MTIKSNNDKYDTYEPSILAINKSNLKNMVIKDDDNNSEDSINL